MITKLHKQAIAIFLCITTVLTVALLVVTQYFIRQLINDHTQLLVSQAVLLFGMFIPAISAIIVQRFVLKNPIRSLGFKLGHWQNYTQTYLTIALVFFINYGLTWAFVIPADWSFAKLITEYAPGLNLPSNTLIIIGLSLLTFIIAPLINMIPALGEEIGWRGFLLPVLAPLGKLKATVVSAFAWSLWHTPIIVLLSLSDHYDWSNVFWHFIMVFTFGIWLAYTWLKTKSSVLTAFMHATFNANAYVLWLVIFNGGSKLIIDRAGIIGALSFLFLAIYTVYVIAKGQNWHKIWSEID